MVKVEQVENGQKVSVQEVVKAGSWFVRNVPTLLNWFRALRGKLGLVLIPLLLLQGCAGIIKVIAQLPDLPLPPQVTPRPTVTPVATLEPSVPTVTATPTTKPTFTLTPTNTPLPLPTVTPSPRGPGQACMLAGPPWLKPAPPAEPVKVEQAQCPKGFRTIDYTEPNSSRFRRACVVDWVCAQGTNGRSLAENAAISIPGSIRLDSDGFVRDMDNNAPCGGDAWGRKVCNGLLAPPPQWEGKEEKWWAAAAACDPPRCSEIPEVTPEPQRPPNTSCEPVEALEHWIVGGGHCHAWKPLADGLIRCTLDSTVRPICDLDHLDNWNSFCGQRTHDPNYDSPEGAQLWFIDGAEDRGPNPENSAQRVIVGPPGGSVTISVCLRGDARTADGCRIPTRGNACNTTTWNLPTLGSE